MPLSSGSILNGHYRIEAEIGRGAYGHVYRARDTRLDRPVAIKELAKGVDELGSSIFSDYVRRFEREARVQAGFNHPNIIHVYELIQEGADRLYLVMEFVDGESLRDVLARRGPLPINEAAQVAADILAGLAAVHADSRDIVHRDIKPSNVMLTKDGRAKLADFGLAQVGDESLRSVAGQAHPGTAIYMSPEQETTNAYLYPTSDVFSVGCVLFEMLAGTSYKRAKKERKALADLRPETPPWLAALVTAALAKDPDDRPENAAAMAHMLTEARAKVEAESQAQARSEAEVRAKAETQARAEEEARAKADAQARAEEDARANAEAQARAAEEARVRSEAETRAKAQAEAQRTAEAEAERTRLAAQEQRRREAEEQARKAAELQAQVAAQKAAQEAKQPPKAETGAATPARDLGTTQPKAEQPASVIPRFVAAPAAGAASQGRQGGARRGLWIALAAVGLLGITAVLLFLRPGASPGSQSPKSEPASAPIAALQATALPTPDIGATAMVLSRQIATQTTEAQRAADALAGKQQAATAQVLAKTATAQAAAAARKATETAAARATSEAAARNATRTVAARATATRAAQATAQAKAAIAPTAKPTSAPTAKPTSAPAKPTSRPANCEPWHKKPAAGYGIVMIENHLGEELSVDYAVGGSGHWFIAAKQGDVPGRWWAEVPAGTHVFNYSTPKSYGRATFQVEGGKSYVSPLWYNDRSDDFVYPMDIPAGCQ